MAAEAQRGLVSAAKILLHYNLHSMKNVKFSAQLHVSSLAESLLNDSQIKINR